MTQLAANGQRAAMHNGPLRLCLCHEVRFDSVREVEVGQQASGSWGAHSWRTDARLPHTAGQPPNNGRRRPLMGELRWGRGQGHSCRRSSGRARRTSWQMLIRGNKLKTMPRSEEAFAWLSTRPLARATFPMQKFVLIILRLIS